MVGSGSPGCLYDSRAAFATKQDAVAYACELVAQYREENYSLPKEDRYQITKLGGGNYEITYGFAGSICIETSLLTGLDAEEWLDADGNILDDC